jgi:hypothetical protein
MSTALPPPDGIFPLFLRGATCEKYGFKNGEGVMDLVDYKILTKEELMKEIIGLGVMSDFEPARKSVESYPGEEILITVDKEQVYGEVFLICYTEEAKDKFMSGIREAEAAVEAQRLAEIEIEEARKAAEYARLNVVFEDKPVVPRKWESATLSETEAEVKVLSHQRSREPIVIEIQRPRNLVHQKYNFLDREASFGGILEFRAYKDPHNVVIRQKDFGIQAAPFHTDGAAQTTWNRPANKSVQCKYLINYFQGMKILLTLLFLSIFCSVHFSNQLDTSRRLYWYWHRARECSFQG